MVFFYLHKPSIVSFLDALLASLYPFHTCGIQSVQKRCQTRQANRANKTLSALSLGGALSRKHDTPRQQDPSRCGSALVHKTRNHRHEFSAQENAARKRRRFKYSSRERLFHFLLYFRHYPKARKHEYDSSWSKSSLLADVAWLRECFATHPLLMAECQWPAPEKLEQQRSMKKMTTMPATTLAVSPAQAEVEVQEA